MRVVVVGEAYTPGRARAAAAAGLAAPPAPGLPGAVVIAAPGQFADPGPDPAGPPPADLPCVRADDAVAGDLEFRPAALTKALGLALAGRPSAVALDGAGPTFLQINEHGERAHELPRVVARVLYWDPGRPAVVHFCPAPLVGHYAREWMRLVSGEPVEVRNFDADQPGDRLRFHLAYAARERALHHPKARARRAVAGWVRRAAGRVRFW